jgi:hypothetical protein
LGGWSDGHGRCRSSRRGSGFDRTCREPLHFVDELLGVERFLDEIVSPRVLPLLGIVRLLLGGEQQDGDRGILGFDLGANGIAAGSVQRDVAENHGGTLGSKLGEARVGAVGADDAEIFAGEGQFQHFAHGDAVVDGEQGRGHGRFSSSG